MIAIQGDTIHWVKDGFTAQYPSQARLYDLYGKLDYNEPMNVFFL